MIKLEKQRLARERHFFQQEENQVKYQQALAKQDLIEADVIDNLTKMIVNLLKPDLEQMKQFGFQAASEEEEGKIEERISQVRAEELLEAWKRLKVKSERDGSASSNSTPLLEDTKVND